MRTAVMMMVMKGGRIQLSQANQRSTMNSLLKRGRSSMEGSATHWADRSPAQVPSTSHAPRSHRGCRGKSSPT